MTPSERPSPTDSRAALSSTGGESNGVQGLIKTDDVDDVTVVRLIGDHDLVNVADLRETLDSVAASQRGLVVSLVDTEFIDSGVVHALFSTDGRLRERDRRLVLHVATASIVARMLEVSGLRTHVPCCSSLDEALSLAARQSREA
jgi:anti-anti-sigma factor